MVIKAIMTIKRNQQNWILLISTETRDTGIVVHKIYFIFINKNYISILLHIKLITDFFLVQCSF